MLELEQDPSTHARVHVGPDHQLAYGTDCAAIRSPGFELCGRPARTKDTLEVDSLYPAHWSSTKGILYLRRGPGMGPDFARNLEWVANPGAELTSPDGSPLGELHDALGWFASERDLGDRLCFELSWSAEFDAVEVCVARAQLGRRYTGPLTLDRRPELSTARERALRLEQLDARLYDCARLALGVSNELPRTWQLELGFNADDHLAALDVGQLPTTAPFALCIARMNSGLTSGEIVDRVAVRLHARARQTDKDAWVPTPRE